MDSTTFIEFGFMYNSFAKRGTVLYINEGALRKLLALSINGLTRVPSLVIEALNKIQTQPFISGDVIVLEVSAELRKNGISEQKIFSVSCRFVPEFRYFAVYSISEQQ